MPLISARTLSLAAVCLQSTVLAIVLHVSQAHLEPGQTQYKASSAVLLTELGKLVISALLALRDTLKERATLLAPRHPLPTPELYMTPSEEDLLTPDPITPPRSISEAPPHANGHRREPTLRRRSSVTMSKSTLDVTLDMEGPDSQKLPEFKTLASFQWPHKPISPRLTEKLKKYASEMEKDNYPSEKAAELEEPLVRKILDDPQMWVRRRRMGVLKMLLEDIFGSDWYKMCVPAILFALQNNLIYIAARNLSVPVFQITFQLKTLITALCAVLMLGRRLAPLQWVSLATLGLGVAAMQIGAIHAKANDSHGHGDHPASSIASMNYVTGVSAVVVSCFSSAIAATYFELVIKRRPSVPPVEEVIIVAPPQLKPVSLWVRNIQLSLFSSIFGLAVVLFQANDVHLFGMGGLSLDFHGLLDPMQHWYDPVLRAGHGFFEGFTPWAWTVIALQTVGGLLIALALKHADNVAKSLSLSLSIVLTFLISIVLFDFKLTLPSALGGTAVVLSTILFESAPRVRESRSKHRHHHQRYRKSALRKWHMVVGVIALTTIGSIAFPTHHYSLTTAARNFISSSEKSFKLHRTTTLLKGRPTIAFTHIEPINTVMKHAAGPGECGWGVGPHRETTRSAYGPLLPAPKPNYPYYITNTDQFALDDILTTRFLAYTNIVPLLFTPSPDFIYLPVLSQIWSNPWLCNSQALADGIRQTTQFLHDIVQIVGKTAYPRIVLPLSPIRSQLERDVLTPDFMEEIKDSVILVSIENAPKTYAEGMKYLIDVPYPTAFHLSPSAKGSKPSIGNYFFNAERPYLLHYAAAASHPWGLPASDPFNGFALRAKLREEFEQFVTDAGNSTSRILFDDISNSVDGAQQLELFHEHMEQAVFCPMPAGDSPTRRAIYEALLLGCIPVVFREHSYGRLFPSSPEINDMAKYTVFVEENDLINSVGPGLIERLEAVPASQIRRMQEHIRRISPQLQWALPEDDLWFDPTLTAPSAQSLPPGRPVFDLQKEIEREERNPPMQDAFETLLKELDKIKRGEWVGGRARDVRKGMQKFGSTSKRLR